MEKKMMNHQKVGRFEIAEERNKNPLLINIKKKFTTKLFYL